MNVITESEVSELKRLESVINRGKKAFLEVGAALKEVRDRHLYRASHKTFAAYVEEKLGFKRRYAYNLIESAEAVGNVQHAAQNFQIDNARQATELAKAPEEKREAVVERAVEIAEERGKRPTAEIIKEARQELCVDPVEVDEFEGEHFDDDEQVIETKPVHRQPARQTETGRMQQLREVIDSLTPTEIMTVKLWLDDRILAMEEAE